MILKVILFFIGVWASLIIGLILADVFLTALVEVWPRRIQWIK